VVNVYPAISGHSSCGANCRVDQMLIHTGSIREATAVGLRLAAWPRREGVSGQTRVGGKQGNRMTPVPPVLRKTAP
jgi:hypothetical protein